MAAVSAEGTSGITNLAGRKGNAKCGPPTTLGRASCDVSGSGRRDSREGGLAGKRRGRQVDVTCSMALVASEALGVPFLIRLSFVS